MRIVKFAISNTPLQNFLNLPRGAEIKAVFLEGLDHYYKSFHVLVESPDLPEISEGEEIPERIPVWRRVIEEGYKTEFVEWQEWGKWKSNTPK